MNRYRKIFHHIDIKDVKDRHLEEFVATKLKQEKRIEEEKYITAEGEKLKVDWRKELEEGDLKESDWTLTTSGNKIGATFQHISGTSITVSSGLGGEDVHSTSPVTVDWGFGETEQVSPPTYGELPLAGIPMPVSAAMPIHRQNTKKKAKEINKQLDSSEKVAAKAKADALMKGRVSIVPSKKDFGIVANPENWKKYKEEMKAHDKKMEIHNEKLDIWQQKYDKAYNEYKKKYDAVRAHNRTQFKSRYDKLGSFVKKYGLTIGKGFGSTIFTDRRVMKNPDYIPGESGPDVPPQILFVFSANASAGLEFAERSNVRIMYPRKENGAWLKMENKNVEGKGFKTSADLGKYGSGQQGREADRMITNTGGVHESIDFDVHNLQQEPQFSFEDAPIPPKKPFEPATVNLAVSGIVKQLSQFGIKDKLLNDIVSRVPQHLQVPGKMFLGYLTGTTPAKIDNSFYGEKAISELAKALQVKRNQYGQITGIGVGSDPYGWHNMVGGESPQNLTLGPDGKIRLKVNYVVEADHVEILKHGNQDMLPDSPLGKALVRLATYINGGGFGIDTQGGPKLPTWLGGYNISGWAVAISKLTGGAARIAIPSSRIGKDSIPQVLTIDPSQMDLSEDLMQWVQEKQWEQYAQMEMEFDPNQPVDPTTPVPTTPVPTTPVPTTPVPTTPPAPPHVIPIQILALPKGSPKPNVITDKDYEKAMSELERLTSMQPPYPRGYRELNKSGDSKRRDEEWSYWMKIVRNSMSESDYKKWKAKQDAGKEAEKQLLAKIKKHSKNKEVLRILYKQSGNDPRVLKALTKLFPPGFFKTTRGIKWLNGIKLGESKVFDRIKKDFSYKGKPSPDGFPDTPPPKLKNGWHPEYGKADNRYNRLDPISAKSMPKTGEASIDKKVEKAKKNKK